MGRIAFIHATRVAIPPIEMAAGQIWPAAETISIMDESLSIDRQKSRELSTDLFGRIVRLARYAENAGANAVLFTCSAFGEAIDKAADTSAVPIMKPNEAMFDAALRLGDRVAMIYTFPPAAKTMEEEFEQAAQEQGRTAVLTSYFCEGALKAKRAGDDALHDHLVAETAREITDADVIMLAQFSMAGAAEKVRRQSVAAVLTSPEAAMREIRRRVERIERSGSS